MEVTHTYKVHGLEQINDESGTVCSIWYSVTSTDGENSIDSSERGELNTENIQNFIDFENLTEEVVTEWAKNHEHSPRVEQSHIRYLEYKRNPPKPATIHVDLPWSV